MTVIEDGQDKNKTVKNKSESVWICTIVGNHQKNLGDRH